MKYIIYQTTNIVNDKIYVGVHNGQKQNYLGSGTLIKQAISKYGKANFKREILFSTSSKEEAFALEASIVNEEFVNRSDTYNLAIGGFGGGCKHSESTKYKISKSNTGKILSKETKAKISKSRIELCKSKEFKSKLSKQNSGANNPFFGKTHSKEHMQKLLECNYRKRKPCIIDDIKYDSRKSAAEALNVTSATISKWFKKGRGGYI